MEKTGKISIWKKEKEEENITKIYFSCKYTYSSYTLFTIDDLFVSCRTNKIHNTIRPRSDSMVFN